MRRPPGRPVRGEHSEKSGQRGGKGRRGGRKSANRSRLHRERLAKISGRSSQEVPLGNGILTGNKLYKRLSYKEVRDKMERKLANFKKGLIPREERLRMADKFANNEDLKHIDETILEIEACEMAKRYARYYVPVLGNIHQRDHQECTDEYIVRSITSYLIDLS